MRCTYNVSRLFVLRHSLPFPGASYEDLIRRLHDICVCVCARVYVCARGVRARASVIPGTQPVFKS